MKKVVSFILLLVSFFRFVFPLTRKKNFLSETELHLE